MPIRKTLLRFIQPLLCLCLLLGMGITAWASSPSAAYIITILPPGEHSAQATIRLDDINGTGFESAHAKLGDDGIWHDITACLRRDGRAYFEITHSGRVYVSVTDNAGVAHVSSRHIEFTGAPPPPVQPTPPEIPSPPPVAPEIPTEPTTSTEPGAPGNVSITPIDGTGTVIENSIQTPEVREFFTITTQRGGVFYLVVDRARPDGNVYLLSEVTEEGLFGFTRPPYIPQPEPEPTPSTPIPEPAPEEMPPAPQPPPQTSGRTFSIGPALIIIVVTLAFGGAAYYIKIFRPKRDSTDPFGDDEDDYEDDDNEEFYEYDDISERGDDDEEKE